MPTLTDSEREQLVEPAARALVSDSEVVAALEPETLQSFLSVLQERGLVDHSWTRESVLDWHPWIDTNEDGG